MGKLIVIEGTDGSGKSTQFKLMAERLEKEEKAFKRIVFPRYSEESSALIRLYLGGAEEQRGHGDRGCGGRCGAGRRRRRSAEDPGREDRRRGAGL